jgi:L-amino acid N-acyltransferase
LKIVACDPARHAAPILDIFNEAIANSVALYDYRQRTLPDMEVWFAAKRLKKYPVIGAVDDAGTLMGFASYGQFRERPAYKYSIEHSVYVDTRFRGQGVGKALLREIIRVAEAQDYHVMVGGIDASNAASIRLHEAAGFTHCGTIKQSGFKFGRWLDLALYQLILRTPKNPLDG